MSYDIITVNGGHSAKATGASGSGYKEHEVARQFKDKLISALESLGIEAVDTTSDGANANAVLQEQARKCNAVIKRNRLDVSIHLNAGGGTGVEVLYYNEKALASKVSEAISKAAGLRDRGAKQRKELYFLRNTDAPAILIELCFIDNADDMAKLMANADAIIIAIIKELTGKEVVSKVTAKAASDVYRVKVNGKQVGAFAKSSGVLTAVEEALKDGAKTIEIEEA